MSILSDDRGRRRVEGRTPRNYVEEQRKRGGVYKEVLIPQHNATIE